MNRQPLVRRRLAIAVLFGLTAAWGSEAAWLPGVSAADPSADIPGIALPGPVAAGRLGGSIYDVVYQVTVEPGHVIVAGLTGTTGTDFDLYLFDSTATTVQSTTGLLASSKGPTSDESISWPSRLGGTYYIDLNGATNVEGDYRLNVQTALDPTPPVVSVVLADGRAATNQLTVPVAMAASDDLSGVSEMAFSADGITYGDWQSFSTSATWTFPPGDGVRELWVKVRNGVGVESAAVSDRVLIDTVAPRIVEISPSPGGSVSGLRPSVSVRFSEAIDPTTWSDLGLVVQSSTGVLVDGSSSYDAATHVGSFVPKLDLQRGGLYLLTLGNVRDLAGNPVVPIGSWTVTPLAPTKLSAVPDKSVVAKPEPVRISVALQGTPGPAAIDVQAGRGAPLEFTDLTSIAVSNGSGFLQVTPTANTLYRFVYAGEDGLAPATSDVRILVRRSATLVGRSTTVPAKARVGSLVTLTAVVGPVGPGVPVSFALYRLDAARHRWVYAGSHGRATGPTGRASYAWTPAAAGSYYWRVVVGSTSEFANGISPVYRWTVSR